MAAAPDALNARPPSPWRAKLAAFWRWWTGELAQLVPERFAQLRGMARVPVVELGGDEIILVEPKAAVTPETRVDLASLDEPRCGQAVRALLERAGETRLRATLCLAAAEALVRRVTMPAATEENLAQVIAFEMDRLTPFRAEEVYFDQRVIARDAARGQVSVQLAVARRDVVDARVEKLRSLGVSVQGVTVREEIGRSAALDLLPSEQHGERESARERLVNRSLIGATLVLLAVALLLPVWQKREAVIALHPLLGKAKQEAEATDSLARELERQVADYNFLLARKHGASPVLALIEEVSRILPDNTWLQQMDVKTTGKTREVQLSGETVSSSKLIELLEQSPLLQNATTRGSVVRGATPGTERFTIAAEARARTPPEARPVMESAPASVAPAPPKAAPPKPTAEVQAVPPAPAKR